MGVLSFSRHAFNRGILSPLGLARTDIEKLRLAAERMVNWMPRVLGSMMLRPGMGYLGTTKNNAQARHIPFIKSTTVTADQAVVELTDSALRVRVDEAIVTRAAVSTTIRGGDFSSDVTMWDKQPNPATLPSGGVGGCAGIAFSPAGDLLVIGAGDSPFLQVYSVSGSTFTAHPAPPASLPNDILGVAFSPDGQFLALACQDSPYLLVYAITGVGAAATFTKLADPGTLPTGNGWGVAFSPNSARVAIVHTTTPFVSIYDIVGTGGSATLSKIANPGTLPAGTGQGVSFSRDGQFMAVAHLTTPFVTIYAISGSTFTKIANPASLPAGTGEGCAFSYDSGYLAVAHQTTPFITVYAVSGAGTTATFTKLANPGTLPAGIANSVAFSTDGQFLAVGHFTSPFISIYRLSGAGASTTLTFQTSPATVPTGTGNSVAFSLDNHWLAVAQSATPYITIYEAYQWLDLDESGGASTYQGSSGVVAAAGPLTLGAAASSWNNYTFRILINAAQVAVSGTSIQLVFKCAAADQFQIDKCYIGHAAVSGDPYDFESAPTQVTFSGSAGFNISNGVTVQSDTISFNLDEAKNLVVSFRVPITLDGFATTNAATGWSSYYKAGDDASTVNATGYTLYGASWVLGLQAVYVIGSATPGNYLSMVGTGYQAAKRVQAVAVRDADKAVEHALSIVVARGAVTLRVGTSYDKDDLINRVTLTEGQHSLAFTPNANVFIIEVSATTKYATLLDSVQIEAGGDLVLNTPWTQADLPYVRWQQSGDVLFCARYGVQQRRIERRGVRSWAIVKYFADDGPYRLENTDDLVTMTPSALYGDITVTASRAFFKSTHVGAIMRLTSAGQSVSTNVTGAGQWTNPIKVTNVGDARKITVTRTGTFSGTVTLQKSLSAPGNWVDVTTYTTAGATDYTDGLDNQTIYYRVGIDTGDYTSGSVVVKLDYAQGQIRGVVRFVGYTSSTVMSAIVLTDLGGTVATEVWAEGFWSDYRGWPSAVTIVEGRMNWDGKDQTLLSVSDAYASFAPELDTGSAGDSSAINRSLGYGPTDRIQWALPLNRLVIGTDGAEWSARSSTFDEPLTPSNFNLKSPSTIGSGAVAAHKIDAKAVFVDRTLTRLYELAYDPGSNDYAPVELTLTVPDLCEVGIAVIAVQRQPDTRIHCVLTDGTAGVVVYDRAEKVLCWLKVETDGLIEDVIVMPGTPEDKVYYTVQRSINSATVRYFEKWAMETECRGSTLNKQADSFVTFSQAASATIGGMTHLIGESVVVWADGKCLDDASGNIATFVVNGSGQITVTDGGSPYLATTGVVGLPYTAQFKSGKLAISLGGGPGLNIRKRLVALGLCLYKTHARGLRYGDDFDHLLGLPTVEAGKAVPADTIWDSYDYDLFGSSGSWSTDSRLCLEAKAPRPCTVLAATMAVDSSG